VVSVNALPTATITGNTSFCEGGNTVLTSNATAGSGTIDGYQWKKGGVNVASDGTSATYAATDSGSYTVTVTNSNGCSFTSSAYVVSVNALAGEITGDTLVCSGFTKQFSTSGDSGGYWFSSNDSIATVNSVSGVLTAHAGGQILLNYAVDGGYCSDTARLLVHVQPTCSTDVSVKLLIQGYYVGAGIMRSALFNSGLQGATGMEVDTISIELRNSTNGSLSAGPVKTILDIFGQAKTVFPSLADSQYIVIKHRNSIETWSAHPLAIVDSVYYDFSNAASKAYGNNLTNIDPGKFAIWSGDLNQDGMVESADYLIMENDVLSILFGCYLSEITGDGVVESTDYLLMENNLLKIIFSIKPF
jgi:hypothetical protein